MRKVKFLGGLLAAVLVAGFTFTSCDEEDLNVEVSNITVTPTVTVTSDTDLNLENGIVYVTVDAVNTKGVAVDATFVIDGGSYSEEEIEGATTLAFESGTDYTEAFTLEITASADGYVSSSKTVTVPLAASGTAIVIPCTITLTTVEEEEVTVETEDPDEDAVAAATTETTETYSSDITLDSDGSGTATYEATVYTGTAYVTEDQIDALNDAIAALTGPVSASTRALTELETAQEVLYAQVKELPTAPGETTLTYTVTVSDASSATITWTVARTVAIVTIRLSYTIGSNEYAVEGEASVVVENTVSYEVTTTDASGNSENYSHSHGSSATSGGGTAD